MHKKKIYFGIFVILVLFVGIIIFYIQFFDSSSNYQTKNKFAIMSTTDIHGKVWDKNFVNDAEQPDNMLSESTAVKEIRDKYKDKTLLWDNGDLYQGTFASTIPISGWYSYIQPLICPAVQCLEHIKYDGYNLGNHEFDYWYDDMAKYYQYLESNNIKLSCANIYYSGNNERVFDPYYVKDIDVDGVNIKIAVIAIENTDVPRWDSSHNYKNWVFHSAENPNADVSFEIKKVQEQMQKDGVYPDFTIVSYHGGFFSDGIVGEDQENYLERLENNYKNPIQLYTNSEAQGYSCIRKTKGIDMFILGHDHKSNYSNTKVKNAEGEDTLVVNGAKTDLTCSEFSVCFDSETGKKNITLCDSNNLHFKDYKIDYSLKDKMQSYMNSVENLLDLNIGKLDGEWEWNVPGDKVLLEQTDRMDFINRGLLWYGEEYIKHKFKSIKEINDYIFKETHDSSMFLDENSSITVDLSINGSVTSNVNIVDNQIDLRNIYQINSYENKVEIMPIKGQCIKDLLEYNASERYKLVTDDKGNKKIEVFNDKYTCPVFYGLNFDYNMNNAPGNRVEIHNFINGKSFDPNKVYLITLNSYLLGNSSNPILSSLSLKYNLINSNTDGKTLTTTDALIFYVNHFNNCPIYSTKEAYKNNEVISHWGFKY